MISLKLAVTDWHLYCQLASARCHELSELVNYSSVWKTSSANEVEWDMANRGITPTVDRAERSGLYNASLSGLSRFLK